MLKDFRNFNRYLTTYGKFVLSTHESPDWDGLGAEIALHEFLLGLGKKSIIVNSDPVPDTFTFLDVERDINVMANGYPLPEDIGDYAQIVLDTQPYSNIGKAAYESLKGRVREVFFIDHHEGGVDLLESNLIIADASSTAEIVYHLIQSYGKELSLRAAQALLAGIVFDTGSFKYPKTTPDTLRAAAHLVELGVFPYFIHEQIYEQNALSSFELRGKILATMEAFCDNRMVAMKLTPDMITETGATFSEGEPAINLPLSIRGVVASVLVKQDLNGPVKVSMRTKGNLDVARIALEHGGGGHKNAAGYKSKLDLEETYRLAVKIMEKLCHTHID